MRSNPRSRGLLSVLSLALVAMAALGAFGAGAAQATPSWHINGKEFTGKESFKWQSGTIKIELTNGSTFECSGGTGSGQIFGGDEATAKMSLSGCKFYKGCFVDSITMDFLKIDLIEAEGVVYEKFSSTGGSFMLIKLHNLYGEGCPLYGKEFGLWGSYAAKVGTEAPALTSTWVDHQTAWKLGAVLEFGTAEAAYLNGSITQELAGAQVGAKLGAW